MIMTVIYQLRPTLSTLTSPAQLYPEYYIDDPIRGGVEQNDVMVHKDTALTYATILDNSYAFFNSVDTAIAEVKDIEKRITLTAVVGDIITGEVTITDTGASTSIVMNVEDVNEDGSVNLSWDRDTDDDGVNDEDASEVANGSEFILLLLLVSSIPSSMSIF